MDIFEKIICVILVIDYIIVPVLCMLYNWGVFEKIEYTIYDISSFLKEIPLKIKEKKWEIEYQKEERLKEEQAERDKNDITGQELYKEKFYDICVDKILKSNVPLSEERMLKAIPSKERNCNLAIKLLEKLKDNSYFNEDWNYYWSEKAYNDFKENIVEKLKATSPQRMDMFNIYSEGISYEARFAITKKAVNELIEEGRVIEKIQSKHGVPVSEYYYCEKSNTDE